MQVRISPEILAKYPNLLIGIVAAYGSKNQASSQDISKMVRGQEQALASAIVADQLGEHPHIKTWRQVYKSFGARYQEHPSSVERLALRVLKEHHIPSINAFVDLYNYISLKYLLPIGGQDIDALKGDMVLSCAQAGEKPVTVLGSQSLQAPLEGEVIYKDEEGAVCRRWNWKDVQRVQLTLATHNALFLVEGVGDIDHAIVRSATHELADLIKRFGGGTVTVDFLSKEQPEITLKKGGAFVGLKALEPYGLQFSVYHQNLMTHAESLSSEHLARVSKVEALLKKGIDPWPPSKPVSATCHTVIEEYEATNETQNYTVAGRVMAIRLHGKAAFVHIKDRTGKLQLYLKQDTLAETFSFFKEYIDIGDIIWCSGFSFRTKTGEVTLDVQELVLAAKSLYPLPEKFHGIADIEIKYRQRYLDLITSPQTRDRFIKRSHIIQKIREYLNNHDFLEVETPMLHPLAGGAAARPFVTHHNALNSDFYLRIAPELYLKRLVIGGIERVYEINRNFRNEGVSTKHNPEFTMLEFYMAYEEYHFIMGFVEDLLRLLAREVCGSLEVPFGEYTLNFAEPFLRMTMREALITYGNMHDEDLNTSLIGKTLERFSIKHIHPQASHGEKIYALFEACAESKLIQPTFIIDFPVEVSPLSKRDPQNPSIAARFELFIAGMELSNGFNELNDPYDQAERFKQQLKASERGDTEAHNYDKEYIHALEYGLPPTVGVGIGIDRLVMLLTNTTSIKEVILFPTLKRKE